MASGLQAETTSLAIRDDRADGQPWSASQPCCPCNSGPDSTLPHDRSCDSPPVQHQHAQCIIHEHHDSRSTSFTSPPWRASSIDRDLPRDQRESIVFTAGIRSSSAQRPRSFGGFGEQLAAAVVQDAITALPVCPGAISNLAGPTIELRKVNNDQVDVKIVHSFTAHFNRPMVGDREESLQAADSTGLFTCGGAPVAVLDAAASTESGEAVAEAGTGGQVGLWPGGVKAHDASWQGGAEVHDASWQAVPSGSGAVRGPEAAVSQAVGLQPSLQDALDAAIATAGQGLSGGAMDGLRKSHEPSTQQQQQHQQQRHDHPVAGEATVVPYVPPGAQHQPDRHVLPPVLHGDWELDTSKVVLGRRIAVGGFAEVFIATYEGTTVAVKRLIPSDDDSPNFLMGEIRLLASLRHPNLLLFMGYLPSPLCMVSEYMSRGSLFQIIRQRSAAGGVVDPRLVRSVAASVARGMAYLHTRSPPMLHRDLKSPNILVDERWRVKICDFGLSKARHHTFTSCNVGGTPEWMAPEVLRLGLYNEAADVYSYGVILWELLTGCPPWQELSSMQVVGAVGFGGMRLTLPATISGDPFVVQLCTACLDPDPLRRPTFPAIVKLIDQHYGPQYAAAVHSPFDAAALDAAGATAPKPSAQVVVEDEPTEPSGAAADLPPLLDGAAAAAAAGGTSASPTAAPPRDKALTDIPAAAASLSCPAKQPETAPSLLQRRWGSCFSNGSDGGDVAPHKVKQPLHIQADPFELLLAPSYSDTSRTLQPPRLHSWDTSGTSLVAAFTAKAREQQQQQQQLWHAQLATWSSSGLAGRRRYRSPLAVDVEPPAVAAKLWDGSRTSSPRMRSATAVLPQFSGVMDDDGMVAVEVQRCASETSAASYAHKHSLMHHRHSDIGIHSLAEGCSPLWVGHRERTGSPVAAGQMGSAIVRPSWAPRRSRSQDNLWDLQQSQGTDSSGSLATAARAEQTLELHHNRSVRRAATTCVAPMPPERPLYLHPTSPDRSGVGHHPSRVHSPRLPPLPPHARGASVQPLSSPPSFLRRQDPSAACASCPASPRHCLHRVQSDELLSGLKRQASCQGPPRSPTSPLGTHHASAAYKARSLRGSTSLNGSSSRRRGSLGSLASRSRPRAPPVSPASPASPHTGPEDHASPRSSAGSGDRGDQLAAAVPSERAAAAADGSDVQMFVSHVRTPMASHSGDVAGVAALIAPRDWRDDAVSLFDVSAGTVAGQVPSVTRCDATASARGPCSPHGMTASRPDAVGDGSDSVLRYRYADAANMWQTAAGDDSRDSLGAWDFTSHINTSHVDLPDCPSITMAEQSPDETPPQTVHAPPHAFLHVPLAASSNADAAATPWHHVTGTSLLPLQLAARHPYTEGDMALPLAGSKSSAAGGKSYADLQPLPGSPLYTNVNSVPRRGSQGPQRMASPFAVAASSLNTAFNWDATTSAAAPHSPSAPSPQHATHSPFIAHVPHGNDGEDWAADRGDPQSLEHRLSVSEWFSGCSIGLSGVGHSVPLPSCPQHCCPHFTLPSSSNLMQGSPVFFPGHEHLGCNHDHSRHAAAAAPTDHGYHSHLAGADTRRFCSQPIVSAEHHHHQQRAEGHSDPPRLDLGSSYSCGALVGLGGGSSGARPPACTGHWDSGGSSGSDIGSSCLGRRNDDGSAACRNGFGCRSDSMVPTAVPHLRTGRPSPGSPLADGASHHVFAMGSALPPTKRNRVYHSGRFKVTASEGHVAEQLSDSSSIAGASAAASELASGEHSGGDGDCEEDLPCVRSYKMYRKGRFFVSALQTKLSTPAKPPLVHGTSHQQPQPQQRHRYCAAFDMEQHAALTGSASMPLLPFFAPAASAPPQLPLGPGQLEALSLRAVHSSTGVMTQAGRGSQDGRWPMQVVRVPLISGPVCPAGSLAGQQYDGGSLGVPRHMGPSRTDSSGAVGKAGSGGSQPPSLSNSQHALELRHYHCGRFGVTESVLLSVGLTAKQVASGALCGASGTSTAGGGGGSDDEMMPLFLSGPLPSWARDAVMPHRRITSSGSCTPLDDHQQSKGGNEVGARAGEAAAPVADCSTAEASPPREMMAMGGTGSGDAEATTLQVGRFAIHLLGPMPSPSSAALRPSSPASHQHSLADASGVAFWSHELPGSGAGGGRAESPPRCVLCSAAGLECGGSLGTNGHTDSAHHHHHHHHAVLARGDSGGGSMRLAGSELIGGGGAGGGAGVGEGHSLSLSSSLRRVKAVPDPRGTTVTLSALEAMAAALAEKAAAAEAEVAHAELAAAELLSTAGLWPPLTGYGGSCDNSATPLSPVWEGEPSISLFAPPVGCAAADGSWCFDAVAVAEERNSPLQPTFVEGVRLGSGTLSGLIQVVSTSHALDCGSDVPAAPMRCGSTADVPPGRTAAALCTDSVTDAVACAGADAMAPDMVTASTTHGSDASLAATTAAATAQGAVLSAPASSAAAGCLPSEGPTASAQDHAAETPKGTLAAAALGTGAAIVATAATYAAAATSVVVAPEGGHTGQPEGVVLADGVKFKKAGRFSVYESVAPPKAPASSPAIGLG